MKKEKEPEKVAPKKIEVSKVETATIEDPSEPEEEETNIVGGRPDDRHPK